MADQVQISTSQNVDLGFEIAPLGDRILAYIIDSVIRSIYVFLVFILIGLLGESSDQLIVLIILLILPAVFYHLLFEIFNDGQSPGKRAFGLRVAAIDGGMVSTGSYILRFLLRIVDFNIMSGIVALIAVAASKKGQRIGDMVAGTTVIKMQSQYRLRQLIYQDLEEEYEPTYFGLERLKSSDIALIKEVLDNRGIENSEKYVLALAEKVAGILEIDEYPNPRRFLRTVVKDFNHKYK